MSGCEAVEVGFGTTWCFECVIYLLCFLRYIYKSSNEVILIMSAGGSKRIRPTHTCITSKLGLSHAKSNFVTTYNASKSI